MPQTCSICNSKRRSEIDEALLAGESLRDIAGRCGTSRTALSRHKLEHLSAALVKAKQAKEASEDVQADSLFDRLKSINRETLEILKEARVSKNLNLALTAIARIEKQIELEAKLLGELNDGARDGGVIFNLTVREYRMPEKTVPLEAIPAAAVVLAPKLERSGGHSIPGGLERYRFSLPADCVPGDAHGD
jgi:hypothetical protein